VCRHLVRLGAPRTLAAQLSEPPHSLLRQTWAPADMRGGGTINVDGFGAGWYLPGRAEPVRYRRAVPMWTDASFGALAGSVRSGAVLAAVRSATVGMPVCDQACAPFTGGPGGERWLFSLNGRIAGWPASVADLAGTLPVTELCTLDAPTDTALLWALVRARLREGRPPADVLADLVTRIGAAAPDSRLNLLLTDGVTVAATAWTHALAVRRQGGTGEPELTVASEPLDTDPEWEHVPDRHLLSGDRTGIKIRPL
jgi:glutamine amidotransferase